MREDTGELDIEKLLPLAKSQQLDIIQKVLQESDVDKIKDLTHLFNAHQAKRQILRINTLNDVQDALVDQMMNRLNSRPDNFDNADLANWMKTVQQALDTSQKNLSQVDTVPTITYQQNNQININAVESLNREERDRVIEALQAVLQGNQEIINLDESDTVYNDESTDSDENNINSEDKDA